MSVRCGTFAGMGVWGMRVMDRNQRLCQTNQITSNSPVLDLGFWILDQKVVILKS